MKKTLLLVLDGWGERKERRGNAIKLASTPMLNRLWKKYPHAFLKASGEAVGLPQRVMGNSEVGHLTLGAGRIIDSDLARINKSIRDGSFFKNKVLLEAMHYAKKNRKLHLMGLLSDSGVHSHISHLFALLEMAKKEGLSEVYVHAFLDGRDTPPKAAECYLLMLQKKIDLIGIGTIATMMGRFYAMDRDNRWHREHKAYDCMVNCEGRKIDDPLKALKYAYDHGETDEFVKPTIITKKCVVEENDTVIFFNFRSDRARELTRAFVWGRFKEFKRKKLINLEFVTLTQYDALVKVPVAFPPIVPKKTLGEIMSTNGFSQLRIAETEKWAHVTYFFNGLCECIFPNEKRIHVPSRKMITYDKSPEMKVKKITDVFLKNKNNYDFFVVNFSNGDMVGHTGKLKPTIRAVEEIDAQIGRIVDNFEGNIIITADHGNCEEMIGECSTCHTTNPVPFIIIDKDLKKNRKLKDGALSDVAPTILSLLGMKKPKEMTGKSLIL